MAARKSSALGGAKWSACEVCFTLESREAETIRTLARTCDGQYSRYELNTDIRLNI